MGNELFRSRLGYGFYNFNPKSRSDLSDPDFPPVDDMPNNHFRVNHVADDVLTGRNPFLWMTEQEQCHKKRMLVSCNFKGFLENSGSAQKARNEGFSCKSRRIAIGK